MPKLAKSARASAARCAELRKRGLRVRVITLPDGATVVLSSPKLINPIRVDHVTLKERPRKWAPPASWAPLPERKRKAKRKGKKKRRAKRRARR